MIVEVMTVYPFVSGSVIVKAVPTLISLSTPIRPPWCSRIFFVIASPKPVPSDRVEKKGLKILERFSFGIPTPVSRKVI